ncbi:hypothetical protein RFF05_06830 [Bengtsoniella intestinalis]|uniref:phage late control D family protein n=1 Tax=Bengtsoniella intestinalis TaxID=3073143 RepID=UPI00391EE44B
MSDTARRTRIGISIDGVDITNDLSPYNVSLTYTDYEEGESDDLQLVVQDRDGIWLKNWIETLVLASVYGGDAATKITATITKENWNNDGISASLPCGSFELDSIVVDGPPSQVTLKATALPYSCQIRQTVNSKAWEGYRLSGIIAEMATKHGMTYLYESSIDPSYDRLEQYYVSDIVFLEHLCTLAGNAIKSTNNTLVVFDQRAYESKDAVRTIAFGDGTYNTYKVSMDTAETAYASCTVKCIAQDGTLIEGTAYADDYDSSDEDNQHLALYCQVSSIAQAQTVAAANLRRFNKFAKTFSITTPGDVNIVAGVTINLADWGVWSGKYLVYEAAHSVGGNGYTTKIKARQTLEG